MPLALAMMSGTTLVAVEVAGARDPALNLVEHQHQVALVTGCTKARQELMRSGTDAALALNRLDEEPRSILVDRRKRTFKVVELAHLEARQQRREAVDHLRLVGGADRRHRPPVKRVREGNQVVLVRVALGVMIFARGLDRAFHRLDARIGEEHRVCKSQVTQPLRKRLALR